MTLLRKREAGSVENPDVAGAVAPFDPVDPFDRLFDAWTDWMPMRNRWLAPDWMHTGRTGRLIRVDEYRENGALVVRAELPGIDPAKDVEITVSGGMLNIQAERREETTDEKAGDKGYVRRELRHGLFCRSLPLPEGVSDADVTATYRDGILEIRIPAPVPEPGKKIPITTS